MGETQDARAAAVERAIYESTVGLAQQLTKNECHALALTAIDTLEREALLAVAGAVGGSDASRDTRPAARAAADDGPTPAPDEFEKLMRAYVERRESEERLAAALRALVGVGELRHPIMSLDVNRDEYEAARAVLALYDRQER